MDQEKLLKLLEAVQILRTDYMWRMKKWEGLDEYSPCFSFHTFLPQGQSLLNWNAYIKCVCGGECILSLPQSKYEFSQTGVGKQFGYISTFLDSLL